MASACLLLGFAGLRAEAATTEYKYDALGRLILVTHDNGIQTNYMLDAAGNRTQVTDVTPVAVPSAPASISVGASSSSGTVIVSWGAASGTLSAYELYESTSSSFSTQTSAYTGLSLGVTLNRPDGTYYYRVRACNSVGCSSYVTAANPMVVSIPPPGPNPPTGTGKQLISSCAWLGTWTAPSGGAAIAYYRVRDTNNVDQNVNVTQATVGCNPFTQLPKPMNVRACTASNVCSTAIAFP